jgi:hypothetical protein
MDQLPALYVDLAPWWPLLSAPEDYEEEAGIYRDAILEHRPGTRTLLELGSGGSNNASHLKRSFEVTLADRSEGMLAVSRRLNPELPHHVGDLRTLRLGQVFDVVFIHDAIAYMTTEDDLRRAVCTAAAHCRPGGMVLLVPEDLRERVAFETSHGGHDGPDGRGLRYLEWSWDPDPEDTWFYTEYAYLLREADGSVRGVHDRHRLGLFPRQTWLHLLAEGGLTPTVLPYPHSSFEAVHELFVGFKTQSTRPQ